MSEYAAAAVDSPADRERGLRSGDARVERVRRFDRADAARDAQLPLAARGALGQEARGGPCVARIDGAGGRYENEECGAALGETDVGIVRAKDLGGERARLA